MSSTQYTKKIALVDCNSFYVSCERLFNPRIRKKPVVVLSNNDGCIISRSNEAKALGIKMGEPYFKGKDIIIKNNVGEEKVIFFETPELVEINSIESELIDFFESIHNNSESKVPLRDGLLALEVAEEIMSQL